MHYFREGADNILQIKEMMKDVWLHFSQFDIMTGFILALFFTFLFILNIQILNQFSPNSQNWLQPSKIIQNSKFIEYPFMEPGFISYSGLSAFLLGMAYLTYNSHHSYVLVFMVVPMLLISFQ